jgi:hypothetical protein
LTPSPLFLNVSSETYLWSPNCAKRASGTAVR